ncbi:hypothetical protein CF326_g1705 [Tilletia indica]|nr:hypothetical protein CF326_g1705 [Tilletia indica]
MDQAAIDNLPTQEALIPPTAPAAPSRPCVSWEQRSKVLEWIAKVHGRLSLHSDNLWLATDIFHRFISSGARPNVSPYHTGLTALWLATKMEGQGGAHKLKLRHFARFIDERGRTRRRMIDEEARILAALDYRLSAFVPPTCWVGRIATANGFEPSSVRIALVIIDATIPQCYFTQWIPKELASIAVLLARKMRNMEWDSAFVTISGFAEQDLLPGVNILLSFLRSQEYKRSYMYRKYSTEEHHSTGEFVHSWALQHFEI